MTAAQPSPGVQGPVAATRRFIAGRTPNPGHRQDVLDGDYDNTEWFAHVQAALTTQPSPGGQWDALALADQLRFIAEGEHSTSQNAVDDTGYLPADVIDTLNRAAAALAARQPVEMTEGAMRAVASRQTASAESNATAEALIAWARQPVGEPVIWVSPEQLAAHKDRVSGDGGAYLPARLTRDGQFTKPLYATPAQAVDGDAERERDMLAAAIIAAAVKSGIYRDGVPMSGPQLLMACDDMAECIKSAQAVDLERFREAVEDLKDSALHDRDPGPSVNAYNRVLVLIDKEAGK